MLHRNTTDSHAAEFGAAGASAAVPQEYDHHKLFERFGYQVTGEGERLPMTKALAS